MTTLSELKELALKATPVEWEALAIPNAGGVYVTDKNGLLLCEIVQYDEYEYPRELLSIANYIAAANPATILAMIKLIEECGEALEDADGYSFGNCSIAERERLTKTLQSIKDFGVK